MSHPIDRGHRLHHRARLIHKRVEQRASWLTGITDPQKLGRVHGRLAATPTFCSCVMCGNPRRHFKRETLAEKKATLLGCEHFDRGNMEE